MRYYAIGDIHGERELLDNLLVQLEEDSREVESTFIFLGDYIDRGPDSKGTIDSVRKFSQNHNVITLMGNHEDMALNDQYLWMMNGGHKALESFEDYSHIPRKYIEWMKELKLYYETEDYFFVHAGVFPGSLENSKEDKEILLWIRDDFLYSNYDWGKLVIHGHTPRKEVDIQQNRVNIDTGAVFYGTLTAGIFEKDKSHRFIQESKSQQTLDLELIARSKRKK